MVPTQFLRGIAESFMPESAAIQRPTETSSGDGTSASWSTIATVSARLSPMGGASERLGADASLQAVAAWRIAVPVGTDVTVKDRIVINGRTFEVARSGDRSYAAEIVVIATEIT